MTADKHLLGAEMTRMAFIFLLLSNAASVSTQFNGYNCDANYHSRFPGENPPQQVLSLPSTHVCQQVWNTVAKVAATLK